MRYWLTVFILISVLPLSANAYVCSRVTTPNGPDTGPSLSWFNRVISIAIHEDGTNQIDADQEFQAVEASYRVWEKLESISDTCPGAVEGSTDIRFDFGAAGEIRTTSSRSVGYNYLAPDTNENIVVFWDEDWPHPSLGGVIALTTTTHIPQDGRIIDADIELNATNFEFTNLTNANDNSSKTDLANTMVHEIGHLLGLGHTTDAQATMFASATPGEVLKRTLDCDDINGIAFKYPAGQENGYCSVATAGCSCVEPEPLGSVPVITQTESYDSNETGGCAASEMLSPLGLVIALGITRRRRKRHRDVSGF